MTGPPPAVRAPFPDRCPDRACGAPKIGHAHRDAVNGREYTHKVLHAPECELRRACAYDRSEPIAHLLRLGSGTPETRTAADAAAAVADPWRASDAIAVRNSTPDRLPGSTAGEPVPAAAG